VIKGQVAGSSSSATCCITIHHRRRMLWILRVCLHNQTENRIKGRICYVREEIVTVTVVTIMIFWSPVVSTRWMRREGGSLGVGLFRCACACFPRGFPPRYPVRRLFHDNICHIAGYICWVVNGMRCRSLRAEASAQTQPF
jgi:hypothetical protein